MTHFYKPRCKCKGKKCSCGASWAFIEDIGIDPKTGKRKQKKKSGFRTKKEVKQQLLFLKMKSAKEYM